MPDLSQRTRPTGKWYVICFHYQMALLLFGIPFALLALAMENQQRVPRVWIWLLFAVSLPLLGHIGIRILFHARHMKGDAEHHDPIIRPPSRVNCAMFGCLSIVVASTGLELLLGVQQNILLAAIPWVFAALDPRLPSAIPSG